MKQIVVPVFAWACCAISGFALAVPIQFAGSVFQVDDPLAAAFPIGTSVRGTFGVSLNAVGRLEGGFLASGITFWDITSTTIQAGPLSIAQSEGEAIGSVQRRDGYSLFPGQILNPLYTDPRVFLDIQIGLIKGVLPGEDESADNNSLVDLGDGETGLYVRLGDGLPEKFRLGGPSYTKLGSYPLLHTQGLGPAIKPPNPLLPGPLSASDFDPLSGEIVLRTLQSDATWRNSRVQFNITVLSMIPEPETLSLSVLVCGLMLCNRIRTQQHNR